jgi:hypothetical protein
MDIQLVLQTYCLARDHRILGAHVAGEQALEVVEVPRQQWLLICRLSSWRSWGAYPTFTAIIGLAAESIVYELGVQPVARLWRTWEKPFAKWEGSSD